MFDAIHAESTAYDQNGNDDLEQLLHPGSHFTSPWKSLTISLWVSQRNAQSYLPGLPTHVQ
jgi:hypothetical protein